MQYGLVGLSIALFFLLLLALSEKIDFGLAYAIAAGASVLLLALLLGALLLFGMVGGLMVATRKVDWYALSNQAASSGNDSTATAPPSGALPSSMRP